MDQPGLIKRDDPNRFDLLREGFSVVYQDNGSAECLTPGKPYMVSTRHGGFLIQCAGGNAGETDHWLYLGNMQDFRHWPTPPFLVHFKGEDLFLHFGRYAEDDTPALILMTSIGEPYAKVTVRLTEGEPQPGPREVYLKGWGECEGFPAALIKAGFCRLIRQQEVASTHPARPEALQAFLVELAPSVIAEFEDQQGPIDPAKNATARESRPPRPLLDDDSAFIEARRGA